MAELSYKDQTRNANPSRQGNALVDLDEFSSDEDDGFTADPEPEPPTVQAVPIVMTQVVPIDENEGLRNELRELQQQMGELRRRVQEEGGTGDHHHQGEEETGDRHSAEDRGARDNESQEDGVTANENRTNRTDNKGQEDGGIGNKNRTIRTCIIFGGGIVVLTGIAFAIIFFFVLDKDSAPSVMSQVVDNPTASPPSLSPPSPSPVALSSLLSTPSPVQPTVRPTPWKEPTAPAQITNSWNRIQNAAANVKYQEISYPVLPTEPTFRPTTAKPAVVAPPSLVACAGLPIASTAHISSGIHGSLPRCLGMLTASTYLGLFNSQLTGTIPSQLGLLTGLLWLDLYNNQFTGTIPSQLGQLTALTGLWLSNNQLTGTIPSQLGQLTTLTNLDLYHNHVTGTIPSQLAQLTALTGLWLHNNQLTGPIPSQLGQLPALTALWLQNNQLTSTVPSFVADISNADVTGNNFST